MEGGYVQILLALPFYEALSLLTLTPSYPLTSLNLPIYYYVRG